MSEFEGGLEKPELSEAEKNILKTKRYLDLAIQAAPIDLKEKIELIANNQDNPERAQKLANLIEDFLESLRRLPEKTKIKDKELEIIKVLHGLDASSKPVNILKASEVFNINPERVRKINNTIFLKIKNWIQKNKKAILFEVIDAS